MLAGSQIERGGSFVFEAGHGNPRESAGGDRLKGRKAFGTEVEGEAVGGDPLFNAHSDRSEFTVFDPNSGEAFPLGGGDAEMVAEPEEGAFQRTQVGMEVFAVGREVDDGVADQLAWSVVSGLASA